MCGRARLALVAVAIGVAPPARAAERAFQLTSFDRLIIEGAYRVEVVTNKGVGARATGDNRALDRLSVTQTGDTVRVRPNTTMTWEGNDAGTGPVVIRLSTPGLRSLVVSGAGGVAVTAMRAPAVEIIASGAPAITVASVSTERLSIRQAGAGSITATGTARIGSIDSSGAATLAGAGLVTDELRVVTQGSGNVTLTARHTARIDTSGSGSVVVSGRADCVVKASGAGVVRCGQ